MMMKVEISLYSLFVGPLYTHYALDIWNGYQAMWYYKYAVQHKATMKEQ